MKACNSCGKCCTKYGNGGLTASKEDIELWELNHPEIASYVREGEIWFAPDTGNQLSYCPWLRPSATNTQFFCAIYQNRPEDCRVYPATIADMIKDDCEMLEKSDRNNLTLAEIELRTKFSNSKW